MITLDNFVERFYDVEIVSGKYLVKTIVNNSPLKTEQFLQARLTVYPEMVIRGEKKPFHIDVTNQTVTHVSLQPIL